MAIEPPDATADPLVRAVQAAIAEERPGFPDVADTVMTRVRRLVTPAVPVLVAEGPDGSRTLVSTRVLSAALRDALSRDATHAPTGIRLRIEDDRLVGVDLALVAAYDLDLHALAVVVRDLVVAELAALVGVGSVTPADVDVTWVDVVVGDARML